MQDLASDLRRSGFTDRESDLLLREVASDIGTTVEQAVGLVVDRGQDAALRAMGCITLRRAGGTTGRTLLARAAQPIRLSFLIPPAAGRTAAAGSYMAMRIGLGLLGQSRDALVRARMRSIVRGRAA